MTQGSTGNDAGGGAAGGADAPYDEAYGSAYPADDYPTEQYAVDQPAAADASVDSGSDSGGGVSWPTVLASAGVAAIISALIVTIGVVGLLIADGDNGGSNTAAQPTVVNLGGAANTQALGAAPAGSSPAAGQAPAGQTPAGQAPAAAPTEQVPEAGAPGGAPAAAAPATGAPAAGAPAVTSAPAAGAQPTQQQAAAAPAALTPGQLTTKVKTVMNTSAPRASRASELQGGNQALISVDTVSRLLASYPNSGFTYQIIGPVTVNGTTMNAQLQMSVPGYGSRYKPMKWFWLDGKWKLSNESVCVIAAYAMVPCSVA
ncbi:hypothetical protein ABLE94_06140 [Gordonia sp. VNK1]|uniref:hypothetical protein n=1 Tax=Gordonia oleivorans TaxID=3156618 RepID=UPI0032B62945